MATQNTFIIRNGLTVNTVQVIDSTGHWVGPAIGSSGYQANTILVANSSGVISNSALSFYSNNNTIFLANVSVTGTINVGGNTVINTAGYWVGPSMPGTAGTINFDGGSPTQSYAGGPAFDCGGVT